uniref:Uncharacterized protein n=1 Tax=Mustela putorius furo TaxID=9669 RepID=M3YY18_MUSPF
MVFGLGCQRERLYKPLYTAHLFILAGVVYYYFQGPVGKTAPDHDMAEEPSQRSVRLRLHPSWAGCIVASGLCGRGRGCGRVHDVHKPKGGDGPLFMPPRHRSRIVSRDVGQETTAHPPGKTADPPGCPGTLQSCQGARPLSGLQPGTQAGREEAQCFVEVSEEDSEEERPGGWVPQLLQKLWLDWFPATDIPKTQNHE